MGLTPLSFGLAPLDSLPRHHPHLLLQGGQLEEEAMASWVCLLSSCPLAPSVDKGFAMLGKDRNKKFCAWSIEITFVWLALRQ